MQVRSLKDWKAVINHFDQYPLITKKRADYLLLKKILKIIQRKEHLTPKGLGKIVALKASMNWGLSEKLKAAFPDVVPVERPEVELPQTIDPNWLSGFTSAEGCIKIAISKSPAYSTGHLVQLFYQLTQHVREKPIMEQIKDFLNCGNVYSNRTCIDYRVSKLDDLVNKIIPLFKKYPIIGTKALDFSDWCKVAEMIKEKKHLTAEGLEQIKKIKAGMNRGRKI